MVFLTTLQLNSRQIVRTILSDSRSLDDNNWQTSILFFLYVVSFAIGPLIRGYLVAVSFRWVFAIKSVAFDRPSLRNFDNFTPAFRYAWYPIVLCHLLLLYKIKGGQPSERLAENYAEHFLRNYSASIGLAPSYSSLEEFSCSSR